MKIVVAIAGVLDPKWPIELGADGLPKSQPDRMVMSPFDESALETALRLRDLAPDTTSISAVVAGGGSKIARAVAAFRIESIDLLDLPFAAACDAYCTAMALSRAVPSDAELVLMGREFGDGDDGAVPPMLAALLGAPFFGRVQDVRTVQGGVSVLREAQSEEERVALTGRIVCSVTNDRRNRLRKPLMKNVMMARNAAFGSAPAVTSEPPAVERFGLLANVRRTSVCEMAQGAPSVVAAILAERMRGVATT